MVQLLGNLTTIAQLSYVRVPALKALFPTTRGSVLDAVDSIVHDGGIWGSATLPPLQLRLQPAPTTALAGRLRRALPLHLLRQRRSVSARARCPQCAASAWR
jgi:hypothetical protein